jgi:transposase
MSADERERSHLVRAFMEARIGQREASERLRIGIRQFKRLVRVWRQDGDAGLVSRQRGRPSNRRLNDVRRAEVVALLQDKYAGFGATLAWRNCCAWTGSRSRWRRFVRCKSH